MRLLHLLCGHSQCSEPELQKLTKPTPKIQAKRQGQSCGWNIEPITGLALQSSPVLMGSRRHSWLPGSFGDLLCVFIYIIHEKTHLQVSTFLLLPHHCPWKLALSWILLYALTILPHICKIEHAELYSCFSSLSKAQTIALNAAFFFCLNISRDFSHFLRLHCIP